MRETEAQTVSVLVGVTKTEPLRELVWESDRLFSELSETAIHSSIHATGGIKSSQPDGRRPILLTTKKLIGVFGES